MAIFAYGAAPGNAAPTVDMAGMIQMEVVDTIQLARAPVLRGPDYLYTRVVLQISAIYNPQATSYVLGGQGANPIRQKGQLAPTTDVAIRHYLSQPRRQLIYEVGKIRVHEVPERRFPCDSANGPFVRAINVQEVKGLKTFLVTMIVEMHINECSNQTVPNAVLSNRWVRERDTDQDYYSTIITRGTAVFDASLLRGARANGLDLSPDDYIDSLLHPIETGFRRNHIQVSVDEENLTANYVIIDREMPLSVVTDGKLGVSRIEAWHETGLTRDSLEAAALAGLAAIKEGIKDAFRKDRVTGRRPGLLEVGGRLGANFFLAAEKAVPLCYHQLSVSVWGHHGSARSDLELVAQDLITQRMAKIVNEGVGVFGFDIRTRHDLAGKFVHVSATFRAGPIQSAFLLAQRDITIGLDLTKINFPWMPSQELVRGVFSAVPKVFPNVGPPKVSSRGSYLGALVAQTLKTPCALPASPVADRNYIPSQ